MSNCIVECTLRTCKAFGTICYRAGYQWGFPLRIFSPPSLFLWRPLLAPWQPIFEGLSFTFLSQPGRIITLTCLTNSFSILICLLGSVESTLLTPNSLDDNATDWTNAMLLICYFLETTTNAWLHSAFGIVLRRIWTLFSRHIFGNRKFIHTLFNYFVILRRWCWVEVCGDEFIISDNFQLK